MKHSIPANWWQVEAGYFRAMRIPLRRGIGLVGNEQSDMLRDYPNAKEAPVVIDEVLARRLFGDEDPIGRVLNVGSMRVVGVVGAVKKSDLAPSADDDGALYYPSVETSSDFTIVVRSSLPSARAAARLRDVVRGFDAQVPVSNVARLSDIVAHSAIARRGAAWLLGALAALALVLALLGIYAVLSYTMRQRTKEIGMRIALGAVPADVARMVARTGVALAGLGVVLGAIVYLATSRSLSSLVYGVNARDPLTLGATMGLLALASALASLPVAFRASRLNPVEAMRD
ncbi:MAG: FtsX-like permease family protein [Gemmatimonadaceae bacterium]